jgi:hypothetical protein
MPVQPAVKERGHDHDAGREELDVGVAAEPGKVRHRLEQRAEQEQPDHRLNKRYGDPPGLAPELAKVGGGHVSGVPERDHAFTSVLLSAAPKVRPA